MTEQTDPDAPYHKAVQDGIDSIARQLEMNEQHHLALETTVQCLVKMAYKKGWGDCLNDYWFRAKIITGGHEE